MCILFSYGFMFLNKKVNCKCSTERKRVKLHFQLITVNGFMNIPPNLLCKIILMKRTIPNLLNSSYCKQCLLGPGTVLSALQTRSCLSHNNLLVGDCASPNQMMRQTFRPTAQLNVAAPWAESQAAWCRRAVSSFSRQFHWSLKALKPLPVEMLLCGCQFSWVCALFSTRQLSVLSGTENVVHVVYYWPKDLCGYQENVSFVVHIDTIFQVCLFTLFNMGHLKIHISFWVLFLLLHCKNFKSSVSHLAVFTFKVVVLRPWPCSIIRPGVCRCPRCLHVQQRGGFQAW